MEGPRHEPVESGVVPREASLGNMIETAVHTGTEQQTYNVTLVRHEGKTLAGPVVRQERKLPDSMTLPCQTERSLQLQPVDQVRGHTLLRPDQPWDKVTTGRRIHDQRNPKTRSCCTDNVVFPVIRVVVGAWRCGHHRHIHDPDKVLSCSRTSCRVHQVSEVVAGLRSVSGPHEAKTRQFG